MRLFVTAAELILLLASMFFGICSVAGTGIGQYDKDNAGLLSIVSMIAFVIVLVADMINLL